MQDLSAGPLGSQCPQFLQTSTSLLAGLPAFWKAAVSTQQFCKMAPRVSCWAPAELGMCRPWPAASAGAQYLMVTIQK